MTAPPDLSDFSKEEIRETLNEIRHPFDIAVYHSQNGFNFGAIVRIGHGFLCRKLWRVDMDKYYKRATMGTHKWENIEKVTLDEFFEKIGDRPIVAFERRPDIESQDIRFFEYPENPVLFFGSEKSGVPDEVIERAHSVVTIPMFGIHNDFNQAVAAGIAMYDWISKNAQTG